MTNSTTKLATLILLAAGTFGLLYYLIKNNKLFAAPGAGGPLTGAGGDVIGAVPPGSGPGGGSGSFPPPYTVSPIKTQKQLAAVGALAIQQRLNQAAFQPAAPQIGRHLIPPAIPAFTNVGMNMAPDLPFYVTQLKQQGGGVLYMPDVPLFA